MEREDNAVAAARDEGSADGIVGIDTPCRLCQYNLKSLRLDARCPECGTAVALSVRGDLLSQSNPRWVATLRTGVWLMMAGWGLAILAIARVLLVRRGRNVAVDLTLSCLGAAGAWTGVWLVSSPDPSGLGEERYGRWRRAARVMLSLQASGDVIGWVLLVRGAPAIAITPLWIAQRCLGVCAVIGLVAVLRYLALLAPRIPDVVIERRARFLSWAMATALGYVELVLLLYAIVSTAGIRRHRWYLPLTLGAGLAMLAEAVLTVVYLLMLGRLNRRLGEAAAMARASWREGGAT